MAARTAPGPGCGRPAAPLAGSGRRVVGGWRLEGGIEVRCTGVADGDLAGSGPEVEARRGAVVGVPWTLLRQVHEARVVQVDRPGGSSGEPADAAVTATSGAALAVLTADCAPVALASPEGVLGVAHAGWRGLLAGVVEATVDAMRRLGAGRVVGVLGPCVHPCCYAFGEADLVAVAARLGPAVRAEDRAGHAALDLPAGVGAALSAAGATLLDADPRCTGCTDGLWSWRTGRATARQATVVWRP